MATSDVLLSMGAGAGAGAAVGGPWGALAGGAIGLAAGLFGEYEAAENERAKQKVLEKAAAQLNTNVSVLKNKLDAWYADPANAAIGKASDKSAYRGLVEQYDPNEFVYDIEDFDNNYSVDDYYAPNRQALIDKTSEAVQHTAAGAGIGRGTGAANQIATAVADKNEELYKDALQAMNQDRQFAYSLWNSKIQNNQNRLNQLKAARDAQISMYGALAQDYQDYQAQRFQQELDLERQKNQDQLALTLASI